MLFLVNLFKYFFDLKLTIFIIFICKINNFKKVELIINYYTIINIRLSKDLEGFALKLPLLS